MKFLGHVISREGVSVDPSKVEAVGDRSHNFSWFGRLLPTVHSMILVTVTSTHSIDS